MNVYSRNRHLQHHHEGAPRVSSRHQSERSQRPGGAGSVCLVPNVVCVSSYITSPTVLAVSQTIWQGRIRYMTARVPAYAHAFQAFAVNNHALPVRNFRLLAPWAFFTDGGTASIEELKQDWMGCNRQIH